MRKRNLKLARVLTAVTMLVLMAAPVFALEKATPQEVVQKVQEAIDLVKKIGPEAALPIIRDKNGPYVWKDSYVVVTTLNGKMLVHPYNPKLEGREMARAKDAKGKLFQAEMNAVVKKNGHGWVEYWWVKPGEKKPSQKVSYAVSIPDMDVICLAGIYDHSLEEVKRMLE